MKKNNHSKIKKIINTVWIIWLFCLVVFIFYGIIIVVQYTSVKQSSTDYSFPWPGILPDHALYKVKVLRNKIVEKLLISPVKKVEYDLLMADKTIYASVLLMEKGEVELAQETVLKGENYFSMLVQDYNNTLLANQEIPEWLDQKITRAVKKHQLAFQDMEKMVYGEDKKTFQVANKFSKINFEFIEGLRKKK